MKAIILSRVSTVDQSLEEQTKELVENAIKDGYKRKDLIIIENKESAIKNDEMHRLGLVEMKERIMNDNSINRVYVRGVTRIGRRYDVLQSIKSFFVTNKIQLVVCGTTRIELLDKDGNVTMLGGLMFEIASQQAIQEMEDKKIRFAQGRRKAIAEGKAAQGNVLYGYTTDNKEKTIEINEKEAEVIRYIFNEYTNTDKSTMTIYRELVENGTWSRLSHEKHGQDKIRQILSNTAYSGKPTNDLHYMAIVSDELQKAAIDKMHKAKSQPKYNHKYTYYAKSLVKCTCGHTMIPSLNANCYVCPICRRHISINPLDYIAWNEATTIKSLKMNQDTTTERENAQASISLNIKKIETIEKRLTELDELEEETVSAALLISNKERRQQFMDRKSSQLKEERKNLTNTLLKLKQDNKQLESLVDNASERNPTASAMYLASVDDDKDRKAIINECIERMEIEQVDDVHIKVKVIPTLTNYNYSTEYPMYYVYDKTKKTYPSLYRCSNASNLKEDVTRLVPKRFHHKNSSLGMMERVS